MHQHKELFTTSKTLYMWIVKRPQRERERERERQSCDKSVTT